MPLYIKNPETEALARRVARLRKVSLTEAVHDALERELDSEGGKASLVEKSLTFARELRARGDARKALPADKAFRDSLYEDD